VGANADSGTAESTDPTEPAGTVRPWLVERTCSDDGQNVVVLVYATPDGRRYDRKERALVSFTDRRDTTAAVDVSPDSPGVVEDEATRERYAAEARRVRAGNGPDGPA
jgi:hypothetical protein